MINKGANCQLLKPLIQSAPLRTAHLLWLVQLFKRNFDYVWFYA